MLFARQHCHWPPVPDFDHKHAMSDKASYANSHHTLKKEEGGKGGESKEKESRGMLRMYSLRLKKPKKLEKTRTTSALSGRQ